MLTSGASAGAIFFYGQNLPTLKNFKARFQFQNTLIRDSQGNVLYDMADISKHRGRRVVRPLAWPGHSDQYYRAQKEDWLTDELPAHNGIPVVMQDATIATEDASFFSNPGFDPLSIVRAGYDNLTKGHIISGASTITQQLVREYMLNPADKSLSRKAEEVILAAELTQKYPKSEILWYYLNSVPYGNLAYGAEAAAQQYFHEPVAKLDLAQSALLSGLPEAPSTYNPVNNLPAALSRMHYVLHLMCQHGYLSRGPDKQCSAATDSSINEARKWKFSPPVTNRYYPHFVQYAIDQLQALSNSVPALKGRVYNGLDVQTTLDPRLQKEAQDIVQAQIGQLGAQNVTDGALVSMDLQPDCYGCIRAMVGSTDYNNKAISGQINMADRPRQPGSSFKPFNYVYAFQNGLAPNTTVLDAPLAIPDPGNPDDGGWYEPIDYDHTWHGTVTLRVALDNSLNIPALKVEQYGASVSKDGLRAVANQAVKMGIKSLFDDNPHCCGWALTLGGLERGVRLVEETAAFGAFGTGGWTAPPIAIRRVWDRTTHNLLYDAEPSGSQPITLQKIADQRPDAWKPAQVLDPAYAYLMNNVLSDNSSRCLPAVCEFGLDSPLNLGRTVAAKTGTTNSFTDNWTVGYTPDIVTGVWVGNADNSPMVGSTGITGAAPIWHDFMLAAFDILKLPPKDFVEPPNVQAGSECRQNNTGYTTYGSTVYDIYASVVPYCSVGTYDTSLPVPPPPTSYQPPAITPQAVAPPTATAAPVATQQAPTPPQGNQAPAGQLQPTALPQPTQPPQPPPQLAPTTPPSNAPGVTPVP
jgi:membrane peptidoglycan carboxypeptidase